MNWEEPKTNPLQDILAAKKNIEQLTGLNPPVVVVSPATAAKINYYRQTVKVYDLPGYRRMLGPDGKEWIEKKRGYDLRGFGNKARRRALKMGYKMEDNL